VIGVILSGTLDDGTMGLHAIKSAGGLAVVRDPEQAAYPGMPTTAIEHVEVGHVVPVGKMGALLTRLTRGPALPPSVRPPDHQPGAMDVEAGSCRIRHILLQVAVPQALETPAEESEPGVGRRVATPSATGSHRQ
jgi:hypothetical protein